MKHFIVTRCKFNDDGKFENYFEIMKKYFIPSINNQTNKNFSIALICNPKHFDLIRNEIDKRIEIVRFDDQTSDYKNHVLKFNNTIQTRHDCDDFMDSRYVEKIHKLYSENINNMDNFILNFHPTKFVDSTQKEYTHSRDYSKVCSMFSTLIQKNTKHGVFDVMHDHLKRLSRNIIYIKEPFVKLVIHGNNALSKLNPNDILIR
jgi:hypothetical protein